MFKSTCWSILIALLLLPQLSISQCGITPKIEIDQLTTGYAEINSFNSPLDSNWIIIENQHFINGVLQNFNGAPGGGFVADKGLHEITYRATVTDTVTGDTCTAEYTNIFATTGHSVFVGMDQISVNGLDVSVMPQFHGNYNSPGTVIGTDWGDGTIDNSFFHTYTNPGVYRICVFVDDGFNIVQGCGIAHVSNGNPLMFNSSTLMLTSCQQIHNANYSSTPAYNGGFYAFEPIVDHTWSPPSIPAGGMRVDTLEVPGQFINVYGLGDPNAFGQQTQYLNVFTVGTCDITPDTVRGFCWYDTNQNTLFDSTESAAIGEFIEISNYKTAVDSSGRYEILMPRTEVHIKALVSQTSVPPSNWYQLSPNTSQIHENINFGIIPISTRISGKVAFDINGDSIVGGSDTPLSNVIVTVEDITNGHKYGKQTTSSGTYSFKLANSNYKVYTAVSQVDSAHIIPDTIYIPATGGSFSNTNFAVQTSATGVNGCVNIIGTVAPRPGFNFSISTVVSNLSTDTSSSTLTVNYDPLLMILSINPSSGVLDTIAQTVTWNVLPLTIGNRNLYKIFAKLPASVPLGSTISSSADLSLNGGVMDTYPPNNTSTISQTVIGSYDPNDKLVNPETIDLSPGIQNPDEFFYHINFQNTGTASAINVVVEDEIDPLLDLSSLTPIDASHGYRIVMNNRRISWVFPNINLPDSNANEPDSKGYIQYTIKPSPNLPVGTSIENKAEIYFDFNAPIITNTVSTNYIITTHSNELDESSNVIVFPNPTNGLINIRASEAIDEVSIYNTIGALMDNKKFNNASNMTSFDLSEYSKGIYMVKLRIGDKYILRKVVR